VNAECLMDSSSENYETITTTSSRFLHQVE